MERNSIKLLIISYFLLLAGCCSFDTSLAMKDFLDERPQCKIVDMIDYECSGTECECRYVKITYTCPEGFEKDTTMQFWKTDSGWVNVKHKE